MNRIANRYEGDLKPLKVRFFIAAALTLALALASVSQLRDRLVMEKTLDSLTRAKSGLSRVKEANANRRQVLAVLQAQFGQAGRSDSPEMILYSKIDEIKTRLKPDEITITTVDKKGGEASLQYNLTFGSQDFNYLLNAVNYLQGGIFPLTPVSTISVTQSEAGKGTGVLFKVTGRVITSEKTTP